MAMKLDCQWEYDENGKPRFYSLSFVPCSETDPLKTQVLVFNPAPTKDSRSKLEGKNK